MDGVDLPIRLHVILRVRSNVDSTRIGAISAVRGRATGRPLPARPVAAKGRVEDETVLLEARIDIAPAPAEKGGLRNAEAGDVGRVARSVNRVLGRWGDGVSREEPHLEEAARPLHGVDAAAVGVEAVAVVVGHRPVGVAAVGRVVGGALPGSDASDPSPVLGIVDGRKRSAGRSDHGAVVRGVQCDLVVHVQVDPLDEVDFSVVRPCSRAEGPEGRPDSTGLAGHVCNVSHEDSVGPIPFTFEANAWPSPVPAQRVVVDRVNTPAWSPMGAELDEACVDGSPLVDVVDESIGRVRAIERAVHVLLRGNEVKIVEERGAIPGRIASILVVATLNFNSNRGRIYYRERTVYCVGRGDSGKE